MGDSNKKIALVTGSATGIGANVAVDLALAGFFVIVTGRNVEKLSRVVHQCNQLLSNEAPVAASFVADLLDLKQVDQLINFIQSEYGRLDVLVNNACWRGCVKNILEDKAYDDLKHVMHVNLSVPMYLIHNCLIPIRAGKTNDNAIIINISSVASQVVVPLHLYSISKACLSELSRQIALMTHSLGLFSVTISPGPVLTNERPHHQAMSNMTLMNRVGTTQEISNLVLFAINNVELFNGKELNIDGGYIAKQKQQK